MRPIEFRGKEIDTGEWEYGVPIFGEDYQGEKGKTFICDGTISPYETIYEAGNHATIVDPNTIGQFTGLYDRNEKKVFEKDLIRYQEELYLVKYIGGAFNAFKINGEFLSLSIILAGDAEVVGNEIDNAKEYYTFLKEEENEWIFKSSWQF